MNIEKVNELFHNDNSQLIFNKDWNELNWNEKQKVLDYEYDLSHPKWKRIIIDNKETNYSVSNIGDIRNNITGLILKSNINQSGYCKINLRVNDNDKTCKVHRLVALVFIPNPDNKREVNHINCNKTFNWIGNLEWTTPKENKQHAIQHGLYKNASFTKEGVEKGNTKYTEEQIHQVCKLLEEGKDPKEISDITSIPRGIPHSIKYRGKWKSISKYYKIPEPHENKSEAKKYKDEIIKEIEKGNTDINSIIKIFDLPDTKVNRTYVHDRIYLYNKNRDNSSSTRNQL